MEQEIKEVEESLRRGREGSNTYESTRIDMPVPIRRAGRTYSKFESTVGAAVDFAHEDFTEKRQKNTLDDHLEWIHRKFEETKQAEGMSVQSKPARYKCEDRNILSHVDSTMEKSGVADSDQDEENKLENRIKQLKLKEEAMKEKLENKRCRQRQGQKNAEKMSRLAKLRQEETRLLSEMKNHEAALKLLEEADSEFEDETKTRVRRRSMPDAPKTLRQSNSKPKLPCLTEETFEEWKLEVEVLMTSGLYQKEALLHAVRNSISTSSKSIRRVLPTIDIGATTPQILEKMENIYGDKRTGESHVAEFNRAKQLPDENVAEWGVRLEGIMQKAIIKGQVSKEQSDEMLRRRF